MRLQAGEKRSRLYDGLGAHFGCARGRRFVLQRGTAMYTPCLPTILAVGVCLHVSRVPGYQLSSVSSPLPSPSALIHISPASVRSASPQGRLRLLRLQVDPPHDTAAQNRLVGATRHHRDPRCSSFGRSLRLRALPTRPPGGCESVLCRCGGVGDVNGRRSRPGGWR